MTKKSTFQFDQDLHAKPYKYEKTQTARSIFSSMAKENENFVFSPLSLEAAMMLLGISAEGQSLAAISKFLELESQSPEEALLHVTNVAAATTGKDQHRGKTHFDVNTAVLNSSALSLNQKRVTSLKSKFEIFWNAYDFEKNSSSAVKDINEWISNKTNGKIKNLVNQIPSTSLLLLANAIYIKLSWQKKFDTAETTRRPFTLKSGKVVDVDMMYSQDNRGYIKTDLFEGATIGINHHDLIFWALRPKGQLEEVTKILKEKTLKELFSSRESKNIDLYLPKFKIDNSLQLKEYVRPLGAEILFKAPNMELSVFFEKKENIILDQIFQGNSFSVDEMGIEAASGTVALLGAGGRQLEPIELKFDKPFLFLLYQKSTGRLVYAGQVVDPRAG